jgi:hypothetical protein
VSSGPPNRVRPGAPPRASGTRRGTSARGDLAERLLPPRLLLLLLAGCLLFGYPFLALASKPLRVFGVPLLYVYLFAAWAVLIAVLARLVDAGGRARPGSGRRRGGAP